MTNSRKCNSCLYNDDVIGCKLSGDRSQAACAYHKFSYYKKGKRFFLCERCKTNSVISQLVGYIQIPPRPRLIFWCQKCNDYPIVEGKIYKGYDIEGIEFIKKRTHQKSRSRIKK